MELTELMNAKVSDVVSAGWADEINKLKEMQERLSEYQLKMRGSLWQEHYDELTNKALNNLSETMYCYARLMAAQFEDSIIY